MGLDLLRRIRARAGVEPVAFVYIFWFMKQLLVQNQYLYVRISEDKGFPYWSMAGSGGGGCKMANSSTTLMTSNWSKTALKQLEIEVQRESANLFLYYVIAYSPMLLVLPFWGSYSDRVGRKVGMVVSLICAMIEVSILLLIMYFKLPIYLVLLSAILQGFSGNISAIYFSCMAYIADSVSAAQLSYKLAVFQFILAISATTGQLTSGVWIQHLGFEAPMWFLFACLSVTVLYVIFILEETRQPTDARKERFFTLQSLRAFVQLFTKPREGGRKNLLMMLVMMGVNVAAVAGTAAVTLLFLLRSPLCFAPDLIGYFNAYKFFLYGMAPAAAIPLLKKCTHELNIIRIGIVFEIAGSLMFAFSDRMWMVLVTPVIGILRNLQIPIFLSTSSKLVGVDEQGTLFAAYGQLNALGQFAGTSLFNSLYPISLKFNFAGFIFTLAAGIALMILIATRFLEIPCEIIDGKTSNSDGLPGGTDEEKETIL